MPPNDWRRANLAAVMAAGRVQLRARLPSAVTESQISQLRINRRLGRHAPDNDGGARSSWRFGRVEDRRKQLVEGLSGECARAQDTEVRRNSVCEIRLGRASVVQRARVPALTDTEPLDGPPVSGPHAMGRKRRMRMQESERSGSSTYPERGHLGSISGADGACLCGSVRAR